MFQVYLIELRVSSNQGDRNQISSEQVKCRFLLTGKTRVIRKKRSRVENELIQPNYGPYS